MGQKGSRGKTKQPENIWVYEGDTFVVKDKEDEEIVFELTRSTQADRVQNSMGLPDDMLCMIALYLSVKDLGSVAKTCKTWRRAVYKDYVWRHVAMVFNVTLKENDGSLRRQVVRQWRTTVPRCFEMIPFDEKLLLVPQKDGFVTIGVISPSLHPDPLGSGRTSLLTSFMQWGKFVEGLLRGYSDSIRKMIDLGNGNVAAAELVDLTIEDMMGYEFDSAFCDFARAKAKGFIVVDTFNRPGRVEALERLLNIDLPNKLGKKDVSLVIVRSKSDLDQKFYEKEEVLQWCRTHKYPLIATSSKENINVERVISLAVRMVLHNHASRTT